MRILPINVVPIFLNQGTITGQIAAQVRFLDVYYTLPPVVGFHVIGCPVDTEVMGFHVIGYPVDTEVMGFHVIGRPVDTEVMGFIVEDNA